MKNKFLKCWFEAQWDWLKKKQKQKKQLNIRPFDFMATLSYNAALKIKGTQL